MRCTWTSLQSLYYNAPNRHRHLLPSSLPVVMFLVALIFFVSGYYKATRESRLAATAIAFERHSTRKPRHNAAAAAHSFRNNQISGDDLRQFEAEIELMNAEIKQRREASRSAMRKKYEQWRQQHPKEALLRGGEIKSEWVSDTSKNFSNPLTNDLVSVLLKNISTNDREGDYKIVSSLFVDDSDDDSGTDSLSESSLGSDKVHETIGNKGQQQTKYSRQGYTFHYTILTTKKYHKTRLREVMATWGRRVSIPFIISDAFDAEYPNIRLAGDSTSDLSGKALYGLELFCETSGADFYVMVDDDTFVIAPNFEKMVGDRFVPQQNVYAGYLLNHDFPFIIGGGGGIVFSNRTMKKLCQEVRGSKGGNNKPQANWKNNWSGRSRCEWSQNKNWPGDKMIGYCMSSLGARASHIDGFLPFSLIEMVNRDEVTSWCKKSWWLPEHIMCHPPPASVASMHYTEEFRELYYLTYQLFSEGDMAAMVADVRRGSV